ncbi:hypothetical protein [Lysobacter changpingensis]|uniref:hypothetical protein n=1 Tax=Lysobacter changpingensis TaxID=2792784 RepID=UPI001F5DA880|nr:hypothetical protein [Lysobacter changpingensis]
MRGRSPSWPSTRTLAWATLALLVVASVAAWVQGGDHTSVERVAIATAVDARLPEHAHAPSADRARPDAIPAPAIGTAVRASSIRERFDTADDLYAYAQSLEPAVRERDADAIWMVSRVYEYCSGFAMAPAAFDRDTRVIGEMGMRGSAAMVAARERVSRRCARFVPQDELTPRMIVLKRVEAAEAGSVAAEASLMAAGEPLQDTPEYKRELVDRVQESEDPEAYSALAPAMGIAASGKVEYTGEVAGTQFSELAWQLAACRLGMDCTSESALMTSYCANGGICSSVPGQDFERFVFDAAVPRQGVDVINDMVDSLMGGKRELK